MIWHQQSPHSVQELGASFEDAGDRAEVGYLGRNSQLVLQDQAVEGRPPAILTGMHFLPMSLILNRMLKC